MGVDADARTLMPGASRVTVAASVPKTARVCSSVRSLRVLHRGAAAVGDQSSYRTSRWPRNLCRNLRANQIGPIEVPKIETINSRIASPRSLRRSRSTSESPSMQRAFRQCRRRGSTLPRREHDFLSPSSQVDRPGKTILLKASAWHMAAAKGSEASVAGIRRDKSSLEAEWKKLILAGACHWERRGRARRSSSIYSVTFSRWVIVT